MQVRTLQGHTNEKNFVGLTVNNEYIACGSETNEVFVYHKVSLVLFLCYLILQLHLGSSILSITLRLLQYICNLCFAAGRLDLMYTHRMHSPLQVIVVTDIVIFWFVALGNLKTSLPA